LVRPRSLRLQDLQPEQVTADLPDDLYRQIPLSGYLSAKFCRSLFPRETLPNGVVPENISCIELPSLEDAVLFREAADTLIQSAFEGALQPLPRPPRDKLSPKGIWSPRLLPQEHLGRRPVLYQVVALISNALVLEAKDFFVFLPDHRELHCILLDKFALNLESGSYGFDRGVVSIRDLVWVYELIPVAAVLNDPQAELKRARIPRMTALDPQVGFFFRVRTYAFVTPAVISEPRYAIVMSVITHRNAVSNVRMALEGTTESVVVPTSLIHFDADLIREGDVLKAITRRKISCAVRFSEPPISDEARDVLCQYARLFFPANPSDALLPMEVHQLPQEEKSWINDRLANFDNYYRDKANAIVTMFRVFNVAASTLAAYVHLDDDHNLHRLEATIPDLADHPLQLTFSLYNMTSDGGWRPHRWIGVWVPDAQSFFRFQVDSVIPGPNIHQLQISSRALPYSDGAIRRVVRTVGRVDDENNSATLDVYLQLFRVTTCALPAYEAVSEAGLLRTVPEDSLGRQILDKVYGAAPLTVAPEPDKDSSASDFADGYSITYHGHELVLTEEQRQALTLGLSNFSIVGIQGAFGTGKTIIGACVASLLVHRGHRVIVTASTNAAVAHITETILGLSFAAGVKMCRFVAETILFDDSVPRTPADMNEVLKTFADRFRDVLPKNISKQCQRFREGRNLIDDHHRNRASGGRILSAFEREELLLAERDVSDLIEQMASVMFKWYRPNIIVITTSSFLNATSKNGIFRGYLDEFDVLLCDEASQLPEPVFAAMLTRLPHARQIHIGDVHQLEPHVRCSRTSTAALLGARSVIDVLSQARAVPMVSLNTTFRAHPNLNELSNQIVYGGTVLSGTTSDAHRLLLDVVSFPNDSLPFIFIDVEGASQRSVTRSHFNEFEAKVCMSIVERLTQRGIAPATIGIITFYREQRRRLAEFARNMEIDLSTVDCIQEREKDVIILLITRTHFSPEAGEFLSDPRRVNVALTRCRHGLFILGHRETLEGTPVWDQILWWAQQQNAIVHDSEMETFLPVL
uniref:AAA_12 domain-containing protein n=1 Tax=Nippostrongylus brasiliensis TaxID=27835 RepID=A0A0N4YGS5_NIPBR